MGWLRRAERKLNRRKKVVDDIWPQRRGGGGYGEGGGVGRRKNTRNDVCSVQFSCVMFAPFSSVV